MACYALYFAILYFGVSPASTYEMLYFPMFLRGLGMMILVIAFGWRRTPSTVSCNNKASSWASRRCSDTSSSPHFSWP